MRFWDILKISLHNIFNNKLRTLLVTLVLFVLSAIIILVASAGVNIAIVLNTSMESSDYADVSFSAPYIPNNDTGRGEQRMFSKEDVENYKNIVNEKCPFLQNMIAMSTDDFYNVDLTSGYNSTKMYMIDPSQNLLAGNYNYFQGGRLWNKNDKNTANAWVNLECAEKNNLSVGDTISVTAYESSRYQSSNVASKKIVYTVAGIIDYSSESWSDSSEVYVDYDYATNNGTKVTSVNFLQSKASEPVTGGQLNAIKSLTKKHNTYHWKNNPEGLSVTSAIIDAKFFIMLFNTLIVVAVLVVSILIILLSIGCVSNSIQITVEQNSKFFGMMKAIGMRNKVVKSIVRVQAVISILIAVLLATGLVIGLFAIINPLLAPLLETIGVSFTLSMPFYVPICVFALLSLMVLLFTIKSLNRISKMDVVSVISEVN